MVTQLITRGKNITATQLYLLGYMDAVDVNSVINETATKVVNNLPDPRGSGPSCQGVMLGLVQSGKTGALATSIALAADNGYRCFVVLTTDNLWLYDQTLDRLKEALPGLQIVGKEVWEQQITSMANTLRLGSDGLVLVTTKNGQQLQLLTTILDRLKAEVGGVLPAALVIDDEADQASLDTNMSRRSSDPTIDPGRVNDLVTQIRQRFPFHAYLQVTATPQALFLQDPSTLYRPEFTVLVPPGIGYVGGSTFFSLINGQGRDLIRGIDQQELNTLMKSNTVYVPPSLARALCLFFVGATIKALKDNRSKQPKDLVYSFLCHISQKKVEHEKAYAAVSAYHQTLRVGLSSSSDLATQSVVLNQLREAYDDLLGTLTGQSPSFREVIDELSQFIVGTDIQVLNSDRVQDAPTYNRRYNVLIGGTKLARGVTIKNLLVTYYGRQAKTTKMDTMLQHARMYGYRQGDLEVIRLFITDEVAERFRLISESEEALRSIIETYPNEVYRGIVIGKGLRATRSNVLNPNSVGAYTAGSNFYPRQPLYLTAEVSGRLSGLDSILLQYPFKGDAVRISIDRMIELLSLAQWSTANGNGLWDDTRIVTSLEVLKRDVRYNNIGYLIVRTGRTNGRLLRDGIYQLEALLNESDRPLRAPHTNYPVLYFFRQEGSSKPKKNWDDCEFWVPSLWFPDGPFAVMFNFE